MVLSRAVILMLSSRHYNTMCKCKAVLSEIEDIPEEINASTRAGSHLVGFVINSFEQSFDIQSTCGINPL